MDIEALVERVRNKLFANLSHYRQHCINERADAEEVAKFIMAERQQMFRAGFRARDDLDEKIKIGTEAEDAAWEDFATASCSTVPPVPGVGR